MKRINKHLEFIFTNNINDYDNVKEVYCDSKTSINYIMQVFYILFAIVFYYVIYNDFIKSNLNINFEDIILIFFMFLLATLPAFYYTIKIINFNFYINDEKVKYKNIIGRIFIYSFSEIKNVKYNPRIRIGSGISSYIKIVFNDKKEIKISESDKNYEQLKIFLNSRNMLHMK